MARRRCPGLLKTFLLLGREQSRSRENILPSRPLATSLPPLVFLRPPSGGLPLGAPSVPWGGVNMNLIPQDHSLAGEEKPAYGTPAPALRSCLFKALSRGGEERGQLGRGSATYHSLHWGRHAFCLVARRPGIAPSLPLGAELPLPPVLATIEGSSCPGEEQLLGVGCGLLQLPPSIPGRVPDGWCSLPLLPPGPQDRDGPCPSLCAQLMARDCAGKAVVSEACPCSGRRGRLLWWGAPAPP